MKSDELIIYRRRLPHWRVSGAIYFVTWRLAFHQPPLEPPERDVIAAALLHFQGKRYWLLAHVVMNDHVHVLTQPIEEHSLQDIVHSWKSYTAHQLVKAGGRTGHVWQEEYFDRVMRDEPELREKALYILGNPWKRWPDLADYPWVACFWDVGAPGP